MIRVDYVVKILTYIATVIAVYPIAEYINPAFPVLFVVALGLSLYIEKSKRKIFSRLVLNILSVGIIVFTISRMNMSNIVEPSIEALVAIISIKFIEADKEYRDYMQIYLLDVFLLSGLALLELGISFLGYMIIDFTIISSASVFLTFMSENPRISLDVKRARKMFYRSLLIPLFSVPLAILIFFTLPRMDYPFFNFLGAKIGGTVGFTDTVGLGDVSNIQENSNVIFRAKMKEIASFELYWRGIVLDRFNGKVWSASLRKGKPQIQEFDEEIVQTIYLEPYYDRYLFGLDKPIEIDARRRTRNKDYIYRMPDTVTKRMEYDVYSTRNEYLQDDEIDYEFFTVMPENLSDKFYELSDSFKKYGNDLKIIKTVEVYFGANGYKHSLTDLPISENPLEEFLFEKKSGNCEFYASSAAAILRAVGIPARMVAGYKGGYYNKQGGYYAVLQKNAHTWVEAYVKGKGWLRIDPTPAASGFFTDRQSKGILFRMRLMMDTISYYWNKTVITYDFGAQMRLFQEVSDKLKKPDINFTKLFKNPLVAIIFASIIGIIGFVFIRRIKLPTKDELIIRKYQKAMTAAGCSRLDGEGLREQADRVQNEHIKLFVDEFVNSFQEYYYGGKTPDYKKLKEIISKIKL